jgi:hypothetical protein
MPLYLWDASDFDWDRGPMDLAAAKAAGISGFTHKLTEGTTTQHKHGGVALARARDAGVSFLGGYMVPRTPGNGGNGAVSAQVDYLLAWAGQLVPWWRSFPGWFWQMDTEHWSYDHVSAATGHQAAQLLAQRTGKKVLHYAPEWAYGNSVPAGEPLWASNYISGSGDFRTLAARVPASKWAAYSGRTPAILQYTSSATIGRQPRCDANAFRGTADDFARLIGAAPASASSAAATQEVEMLIHPLVRVQDGGAMTGSPEGTAAATIYQLLPGKAHPINGTNWVSLGSPAPMLFDSWPDLQAYIGDYYAAQGATAVAGLSVEQLEQALVDALSKMQASTTFSAA